MEEKRAPRCQLNVRIAAPLVAALATRAAQEGRSIRALVEALLAAGLAASEEAAGRTVEAECRASLFATELEAMRRAILAEVAALLERDRSAHAQITATMIDELLTTALSTMQEAETALIVRVLHEALLAKRLTFALLARSTDRAVADADYAYALSQTQEELDPRRLLSSLASRLASQPDPTAAP